MLYVATLIASSACKYVLETVKSFDDYKNDIASSNAVLNDAKKELDNCTELIRTSYKHKLERYDEICESGMSMVLEGVQVKNGILTENGMNRLLELINTNEKIVFSGMSDEQVRKMIFNK